jgi:SAM-dependent methyltransferase
MGDTKHVRLGSISMPLGPTVRRLLGPRLERMAADRYRRMFVDLDQLAASIAALGPFSTVVEVGCGDGSLMTRLMAVLGDDVSGLGIDIAAHPGRAYAGPARVRFKQTEVADVVASGERFDLVVVSDVLHHVPVADREAFLDSCRQLLMPRGTIVVKEWVRRPNVAHLAAYGSDRFVSGDRGVSFYSEAELRQAFRRVFCHDEAPLVISHARPHRNNVILATRATADSDTSSASTQ